ncbi:hypothetical protein COCNU_16G004990 [Cocos nucifera]|uniref:Uncharacterized protein n=1 Tax=Cocos nucifera TaxID=13894 RepID=A0A8K0NDL8_COCNU|nr:hypothetical protein COCNU_16G004990 [Cocos nucifera]
MGSLRTTLGNRVAVISASLHQHLESLEICVAYFYTRQDMLHAQLFCINFVIFSSSALLLPYGMSDDLRQSHPRMFGFYMFAEIPIRGFIYWLNQEHSGMEQAALDVLISKPASTGTVITVAMYSLSLGLQSIARFAGIRNSMSANLIIILTIIWLQCGVPTLTRPSQFESIAAPTQMMLFTVQMTVLS